jgi:DNA invertase Pin-like site-specific DNA recombinase
LLAAGCDPIRGEKVSGTRMTDRVELQSILRFIRPGDTLVVTKIDRLARDIGDLQDIVRTLEIKGASLQATDQPVDTSSAAGKCFLSMFGVFAEFETNIRKERQLAGIAKAKAEGQIRWRRQAESNRSRSGDRAPSRRPRCNRHRQALKDQPHHGLSQLGGQTIIDHERATP